MIVLSDHAIERPDDGDRRAAPIGGGRVSLSSARCVLGTLDRISARLANTASSGHGYRVTHKPGTENDRFPPFAAVHAAPANRWVRSVESRSRLAFASMGITVAAALFESHRIAARSRP